MTVVQTGPYQDALADFGRAVRPEAIIAISAHWGSGSTIDITNSQRHTTIHDFGGFPAALYELAYDAPGSPKLAERTAALLHASGHQTEMSDRGLDHGVWIPLRLMYPAADVPLVSLSLPLQFSPEELYKVGEALAPLRREGVMILGSGGIVHNLRRVRFEDIHYPVEPWAAEFDTWLRDAVQQKKTADLFDFLHKAPHAQLAVPTFEHFAPLFVVLGAGAGDVSIIYEGFEHGNISMRSFAIA
jgi:4,5-DOPA dioxygenase extradiol